MTQLYHELITHTAVLHSGNEALRHRDRSLTYAELETAVTDTASGLMRCGMQRHERVAVYLPKRFETVFTLYGTSMAGGVFVPVNPQLKPEQVGHILRDCNARILITSKDRAEALAAILATCHDLRTLVLVDTHAAMPPALPSIETVSWEALIAASGTANFHRRIDMDVLAILWKW